MPLNDWSLTRRSFVKRAGLLAGAPFLPTALLAGSAGQKKLGVALVGLGNYANSELRPALLRHTQWCRLAGVVTGSARKGKAWSHHYGFPDSAVYDYDEMDRLGDNPDIDIVYVVTPNALHAEHCIRAARAGKHVICEKPFTVSVAEADQVISACHEAGVKLSIGYRLHFDPYHQVLRDMAATVPLNPFGQMNGAFSFVLQGNPWRASRVLAGGGPLMDLGVYLIQEACMAAAEQTPLAVTARERPKQRPDQFVDIEETIEWTMEFPGGQRCQARTSYDESANQFRANGTSRWFEIGPAFTYRNLAANTQDGPLQFAEVNQQALQMDDFARCILQDMPSRVGGDMGRRDMKVIEAIYRAARTGKRELVN